MSRMDTPPNFVRNTKFIREAGAVRRCHTYYVIGEYNVGIHTFNMLGLTRLLWPDCRVELLWAILEHDLPERVTGDIPATTKWRGYVHEAFSAWEDRILEEFGMGSNHYKNLEPDEKKFLKGVDLIELWLFCKEQSQMGNKTLQAVCDTVANYFDQHWLDIHPVIQKAWLELYNIGFFLYNNEVDKIKW
jgi:hypothetical protein